MFLLLIAINTGFIGIDFDYSLHPDIKTLNSEFESMAMSHRFNDKSWGWSWSVFMITNNYIIDVMNVKAKQHEEENELSLDLSFNTRLFETGYMVDMSSFFIYLKAGGGYTHVDMSVERYSDSLTFGGVLIQPGGRAELTASCLSVSAGAGFIVPFSDYFGINISGGYIYGLDKPDWKFKGGAELYDDPEIELRHIYIKAGFIIGDFGLNIR